MARRWKSLLKPKKGALPAEPEPLMPDDEFERACQFVAQVATRAHRYGVSDVRVDSLLSQLPRLFGFEVQKLAAAPFLFLEFWRPTDTEPHRLTAHLPESSFDLTKLANLGVLVNELEAGQVSIDEGTARLKQIDARLLQKLHCSPGLRFMWGRFRSVTVCGMAGCFFGRGFESGGVCYYLVRRSLPVVGQPDQLYCRVGNFNFGQSHSSSNSGQQPGHGGALRCDCPGARFVAYSGGC